METPSGKEPAKPDAIGWAPTEHRPSAPTIDQASADALRSGLHADPHTLLGAHAVKGPDGQKRTVIRAFFPGREAATLAYRDGKTTRRAPMTALGGGLFEIQLPNARRPVYTFEALDPDGRTERIADPYGFGVTVSEMDRWLFNEGSLRNVSSLLGAHPQQVRGAKGYRFVVWAPNAQALSVVGDFNHWNDLQNPMRRLGDSGLWELFVPEVTVGQGYQFRVVGHDGVSQRKADPVARQSSVRPSTASMTVGASQHVWKDQAWMTARAKTDPVQQAVSTYEVHLGSWMQHDHPSLAHLDDVPRALHEVPQARLLNYRELADRLIPWVKSQNFTHIELVGLLEHPLDSSWGYQVSGYFTPTARHGTPDDFRAFVDRCHAEGIGVIFDWVPAHFPKDADGIARFDGTHLFDHEDDRLGEQRDWNTRVFNYGRDEVQSFLLSSLDYMLGEFHLDGVRVDAVASMLYRDYSRDEWIPNEHGGKENLEAIEFLAKANRLAHERHPGSMCIAEESTSFPGVTSSEGLGFDLKWNMGWMNDTLRFFATHPDQRGERLDDLTNTFLWAHSERFVCSLSHDEVVHGKGSLLSKMPGDEWQQFANLRLLFGFMWAYPGHKLLFMGSELGQRSEWDFRVGLDWNTAQQPQHAQVSRLVADLNALYRARPALHQHQFSPTHFEAAFRDADNAIIGMRRRGEGDAQDLLFVHNTRPEVHRGYRVGVDGPGKYREAINTDHAKYGGSGITNERTLTAEAVPVHGKSHSVLIDVPPLATTALEKVSSAASRRRAR